MSVKEKYGDQSRDNKVQSVFLIETEKKQIQKNLFDREGKSQNDRAITNWLYNEWIKEQAEKNNIKTINARPWDTVIDRVCKYLEI